MKSQAVPTVRTRRDEERRPVRAVVSDRHRPVVTVSEVLRSSTPGVAVRRPLLSAADWTSRNGLKVDGAAGEGDASQSVEGDEWGSLLIVPSAKDRVLPFVAPPVGPLGKTSVVTSGFARLDFSIAQLIDRLPDAPLESKFNTVAEWIDKYCLDFAPARVSKCLEALLDAAETERVSKAHSVLSHLEIMQQSSSIASRSMAACFATHQLLLVLCRVQPVMLPICRRVMDMLLPAVYAAPPKELPGEILDRSEDPELVRRYMDPFKGRMHFQAARDSSKRLTALEQFVVDHQGAAERQKRVLQVAVRKWQVGSVAVVFRSWRKAVVDTRAERQVALERTSFEAQIAALRAEVTHLKAQSTDLEHRLKDALAEDRMTKRRLDDSIKRHEFEIAERDQSLKNRDALIDDLEATIASLRQQRATDAEAAEARYQLLGSQVLQVLRQHQSRLGRGSFQLARQACTKAVQGSAVVPPLSISAGDTSTTLDWLRRQLADHDPQETIPRPSSLAVTPQLLDAFGFVASAMLPEVNGAHHLVKLKHATALSAKAVLVANWCIESKLPVPEGFSPETLLRNTRESSSAIADLINYMMTVALCPRESLLPFTPVVSVTESSDVIAGPEVLCTAMNDVLNEYSASVETALALSRAALNRSAMALSALVTGGEKAEQLTSDELVDQPSFFVNQQILGDACGSREGAEEVQGVVEANYRRIRKIFLQYAGDDGTTPATTASLTASDFYRLLTDCRALVPNVVDRSYVTNAYAHSSLDPRRFIAALVTVAKLKYPREESAASALKVFLEVNIFAFAEVADTTWAPKMAQLDTAVTGLITEYRQDLFKIFRVYCTDSNNANKIPKSGFLAMLRDAGVLTTATADLSEATASKIFNISRNTLNEDGIGFDNFIASLCWCAIHVNRDPFVRVATKLKRLIFSRLLPAFRGKFKLAFVPMDS